MAFVKRVYVKIYRETLLGDVLLTSSIALGCVYRLLDAAVFTTAHGIAAGLRCDLLPNRYGAIAQDLGGLPGLSHRVTSDQRTWPARITPGVNRGYRKGLLKGYKLTRTTGTCSPCAYRGALLPFDGDVFVCEPCGNLVRRFQLREHDGRLAGDNAYYAVEDEFLTSTDERFRPVDIKNGPDGALYVVDMYRGVIQHRNYVTSFLRDQVERRGLEQPVHKGRIWRIVPKAPATRALSPTLSAAAPAALSAASSTSRSPKCSDSRRPSRRSRRSVTPGRSAKRRTRAPRRPAWRMSSPRPSGRGASWRMPSGS